MGSLEGALRGDHVVSAGDVIREAWLLVKGTKITIIAALALFVGTNTLASQVYALMGLDPSAAAGRGDMLGYVALSVLVGVAATPMLAPMQAGIIMLGVHRSVRHPLSLRVIFAPYRKVVPLTLVALLSTFLIYLGLALFIVPGIYLAIAYSLAPLLVVEKGLSPWAALEASRKAITTCWFDVFGLSLALGILMMVSLLPFLVGLIWTIPLWVIAMGVLYRIVFGVEAARQQAPTPG